LRTARGALERRSREGVDAAIIRPVDNVGGA